MSPIFLDAFCSIVSDEDNHKYGCFLLSVGVLHLMIFQRIIFSFRRLSLADINEFCAAQKFAAPEEREESYIF